MGLPQPWYPAAYRRAVIDMHIPDYDEKFLSGFNADAYAERLVESRAQSIVAYCQSHVGLFNYPTKVGRQHAGLKGRNILQEVIDRCHKHGIAVVIYTSLIFDRSAADRHPEWRMRTHDGQIMGQGGRHGLLCPNSPYREYVRRFVDEICQTFDFEGIRFDMTFWPGVCFCEHCQKRFAAEVGGEIPKTINWLDERWVAFQRRREAWLVDFAQIATETVRKHKPKVSVEHQSSTYPLDWMFGVTAALTAANDFLQGDFYGDALQGSFVRKLLEDLTPKRPCGFETSAAIELRDHTTIKPAELLEAKASAAIADHAAFIFIDAIDPVGTVNPLVHRRMGKVFEPLLPYYPHLGGRRVADVAVYYSPESKFSFAGNGRHVSNPDRSDTHTECVLAVCRRLLQHHVPFTVITKKRLQEAANYRVLVLANVNMMDDEEVSAVRQWVERGGKLLATGSTALVDKRGRLGTDFLFGDALGVRLKSASWAGREHYLSPTPAGQPFFGTYDSKYPAFSTSFTIDVEALPGTLVLATRTLPWPAPDPTRFASIHSNPPWVATDRPEIVRRAVGKGSVVYCCTPIELAAGLGDCLVALVRSLCPKFTFELTAPACVEATLFHQPDRHRYVLSLVNFQKELPNLPIDGITAVVRLPNQKIQRIVELPNGAAIDFAATGDGIRFQSPRLQTLAMFALEVE